VAAAFSDRSLLWGPYRSFAQMLAEDPRCSEANPMFQRTEHPGVGRFLTATSPLHFGALPRHGPGLAPILGQHTRQVLQHLLGLDDQALAALQAAGTLPATKD
jgi:2-methylfumaryl-CoA isomerase